jgi:hypothetical protein
VLWEKTFYRLWLTPAAALSDVAPLLGGIIEEAFTTLICFVFGVVAVILLFVIRYVVHGPRVGMDIGAVARDFCLCHVVLRCFGVGFSCSGDLIVNSCGARPWGWHVVFCVGSVFG